MHLVWYLYIKIEFFCSSFVNLISDDESEWTSDPAVQLILKQSVQDVQGPRYSKNGMYIQWLFSHCAVHAMLQD